MGLKSEFFELFRFFHKNLLKPRFLIPFSTALLYSQLSMFFDALMIADFSSYRRFKLKVRYPLVLFQGTP